MVAVAEPLTISANSVTYTLPASSLSTIVLSGTRTAPTPPTRQGM